MLNVREGRDTSFLKGKRVWTDTIASRDFKRCGDGARACTLKDVVARPELEGSAGHFSEYARAIVDAARDRIGCRV